MRRMEITGQKPEHESRSKDDHHWVEKLFPPRFTFQNLLETQTNTNEYNSSTKSPPSTHSTDRDELKRSHRRQIYLTALKGVQQTERLRKKEALVKRIIKHEQPIDGREKSENPTDHGEMCIWNEGDISKLRTGFAEVERDRWQLRHQLSCTEEQLRAEHEQKMKLQGLVEKLEEQLSLSKKMASRQALVISDLKSHSQKMDAQLHKLTMQVREKEEEADRWRTTLSKAKEDMQQVVQERFNLMWELERAQAQWKAERDGLEKAARIENEAELLRLQREVEQTRADLYTERESHARSRAALELLRRHFSTQ